MIPVRLMLKNFMSYGDDGQTLSFEGIHVACLSGDNGNGKSALLDAMTWVLWGKTRASSVQSVGEDDLIRRSADEMEVRFEFDLNDVRYRVVRKRRRGKNTEWQVAHLGADGDYLPVTVGGAREAGRYLVQLLSMEYETFLSSAYLQQGHADEFTRQKPAQRKQILAEILGLGRYDVLEARARERARELKAQIDELDGYLRMHQATLSRRAEREAELESIQAEIAAAAERRTAAQEELTRLRDAWGRLEQTRQQRADKFTRRQQLQSELQEANAAYKQQLDKLTKIDALIAQESAILSDYRELIRARQRREQLDPEMQEYSETSSQLEKLRGAIELEREKLAGSLRGVEMQLRTTERQAAEFERVSREADALAASLPNDAELAAQCAQAEQESERLREQFEQMRSRSREIAEAVKELDEVLELLARPQASCPVCATDLTEAKRDRVVALQQGRRTTLLQEQSRLKQEGTQRKRELETAQALLKERNETRQEASVRRARLTELLRQRETLACSPPEATRLRAEAGKMKTQLTDEDFAHPTRIKYRRVEQELERLSKVKEEYDRVVNLAKRFADAEGRHFNLQRAIDSRPAETDDADRRKRLCVARQTDLKAIDESIEQLTRELEGADVVKRQRDTHDEMLRRIDEELAVARRREGGCIGLLKECDEAERLCKLKENERKQIQQEHWTYDKLAACFGKKGIQALIIENAIPQLEEEANQLLADMTDNGMNVRFLTTRAGKSSKSEIETLDISITDEAGARPYELFSGGEAFRVNFAIRIALSRMLAGRSGARLQTLILDEGFGTQDGKGREKLVEAIEAIKHDFEKILVITHVEELKDSFPQRIEVQKDSKGSKIYVY